MDAAKIGGKTARSSASAHIPRWNAGPSTEEGVSSNLFSFQEKQRFTPLLAGRKHRLILARTATLRPNLQKGFLLGKEITTQDTIVSQNQVLSPAMKGPPPCYANEPLAGA